MSAFKYESLAFDEDNPRHLLRLTQHPTWDKFLGGLTFPNADSIHFDTLHKPVTELLYETFLPQPKTEDLLYVEVLLTTCLPIDEQFETLHYTDNIKDFVILFKVYSFKKRIWSEEKHTLFDCILLLHREAIVEDDVFERPWVTL
jgi:hypothetical protein